jgi:hypothetical protein
MKLLEQAAELARKKDRAQLIGLIDTQNPRTELEAQKVFLITTFHPTDHSLRQIVFGNWDLLGKSPTTSFLHERKLMVGYRRPKNLRELLVRANVPYKPGDEQVLPPNLRHDQNRAEVQPPMPSVPTTSTEGGVQKKILDFFLPVMQQVTVPETSRIEPPSRGPPGVVFPKKTGGTPLNKRGFNFCNTKNCRYCPNLDKTGSITSSVTNKSYRAMSNVSLNSINKRYSMNQVWHISAK